MVRIVSPYISEVPHVLEVGSCEDMERSYDSTEEIRNRFDDPTIIEVGGREIVAHGEIYSDFLRSPELYRLIRIKQLGVMNNDRLFTYTDQTRYEHSLSVAIRMEIALRCNSADERTVRLGIVSSLLHDTATPALSDQGKFGDRRGLDEELNIEVIVKRPSIARFLSKYAVRSKDVVACVRGKYPIIGPLLNSSGLDVDKISYLMKDSGLISGDNDDGVRMGLYREHPEVKDIYMRIMAKDDRLVFREPYAVLWMLQMNAWMFRDVYQNPAQRGREAFMEREMRRLWDDGVLRKEPLLEMRDGDLVDLVRQSVDDPLGHALFDKFTLFEEVECVHDGEAEESVRSRYADEFVVRRWPSFNSATRTLVYNHRDPSPHREVLIGDVFPDEIAELEEIAKKHAYVGVYRLSQEART